MKIFLKFTYMAMCGMGLLSIFSCKKNNLVVDKDIVVPPFVKFNTLQTNDTMATYFVRSTNDVYKLPIGVTNVSDVDRTVQFSYTGTAAAGTQFNAPASLVIKAGTTLDTLTISGLYSGYPTSSRKDTLKITISGGDIPTSGYKGKYSLILRKYCDVHLADFYGDYLHTMDGTYGPYYTTVVPGSAVSTGPTSGSLRVVNLFDYYGVFLDMNSGAPVPTTTINLDWADPANFKVTVPDQKYIAADGVWIKAASTNGTFSSCDQTFAVRYTLYYKATGANAAANVTTSLAR